MEQQVMTIEIYAPNGLVYQHQTKSCRLHTTQGYITIMPNHMTYMAPLDIGVIKVVRLDDTENMIAIDGGVVTVFKDKIEVIANGAIRERDIDLSVAEAELDRARERIKTAQKEKNSADYQRARIALNRAINQVNVSRMRH